MINAGETNNEIIEAKGVSFLDVIDFVCENINNAYNVEIVLEEELNDLDNGCEFIFEMHDERFKIYRHEHIEVVTNKGYEEFISLYDVKKI